MTLKVNSPIENNHLISDSPRKIQVKVNLLQSQRNRLENQITNLVTMTITAQRVVDQKDAEIKTLQDRQQCLAKKRDADEKRDKWILISIHNSWQIQRIRNILFIVHIESH